MRSRAPSARRAPATAASSSHFSPDVTLEDDLRRRDLTINAMARDADGALIDPYGGRADLEARKLRHVSEAFNEDPVRILRVARFLARFEPLGFTIAPETLARMRAIVAAGEADALVPERIWQETRTALAEPAPAAWLGRCAIAGRSRASSPSSMHCRACRSRKNGTRRSTPACTWSS